MGHSFLSLPAPVWPGRALLFVAGLLVGLTGCSTAPEVATKDIYQEPAQTPGPAVATLRGSSVREGGIFGSEHRGFVSMVDLQSVPDAADRWDEPIVLSPGKRNITAEYKYSNFMTRAYVPFEAKAGVNYQLMIKHNRDPGAEGRLYNDFWIVDLATGKSVTPVFHRQLTGGKKAPSFTRTSDPGLTYAPEKDRNFGISR